MKSELKNICDLINEKISANELINNNLASTYVSTESMLPNKRGITKPSSIPSKGTTTAYKKDDVLVSNIRPYFKKIWSANYDGVCSNDVLVFRAKNTADANFLYYVLANDDFFVYSMATSKGTKMPRGDKASIMKYEVESFDLNTQRKIASILKPIDKKIELNNAINNNLEQQVTTVFYNMFGKYEQNSNTHKPLSTIAKFKYGTMPKKDKLGTGHYHAFSGYQIVGTYPEVMFENPQLIIVARGVGGCGDVKYTPANCYLTNLSIAIITEKTMHDDYLYHYLRLHDTKIMNTGSAQPQITVATLEKFEIPIPPEEEMIRFSDFVQPFKQQYRNNQDENKLLSKLRDTLLSKLMSGELDVSDIDI